MKTFAFVLIMLGLGLIGAGFLSESLWGVLFFIPGVPLLSAGIAGFRKAT